MNYTWRPPNIVEIQTLLKNKDQRLSINIIQIWRIVIVDHQQTLKAEQMSLNPHQYAQKKFANQNDCLLEQFPVRSANCLDNEILNYFAAGCVINNSASSNLYLLFRFASSSCVLYPHVLVKICLTLLITIKLRANLSGPVCIFSSYFERNT